MRIPKLKGELITGSSLVTLALGIVVDIDFVYREPFIGFCDEVDLRAIISSIWLLL